MCAYEYLRVGGIVHDTYNMSKEREKRNRLENYFTQFTFVCKLYVCEIKTVLRIPPLILLPKDEYDIGVKLACLLSHKFYFNRTILSTHCLETEINSKVETFVVRPVRIDSGNFQVFNAFICQLLCAVINLILFNTVIASIRR